MGKGPFKIYGLYRAGANGVGGTDFFYTYNQWERHIFRKHIYGANTFFVQFYELFFIGYYLC